MTELFGGPRPNFDELLNPQTESARKRVQLLRQKYKMDPRQMKEVDDLYGPLEWRLPESHAIYWASVGLKESKKKDLITLRRVIYQSMQIVVLRGRLISLQTNAPIQFGPNLNQVDRANAAYEQMIQDDAEMRHAIIGAHRNFLKEAVYLLYSHNQLAKANQYFKLVREKYPDAIPANLNLDEYVLQRLTGDLATMSQDRVKAVLEGLITQYFLNLAVDEDDKAEGFDRMGRHLWEYYDQRIANRRGPLEFPPYPEMKKTVRDLLLDPERGLPPEAAARLRTKLNLPTPSNPLPSAKTGARA